MIKTSLISVLLLSGIAIASSTMKDGTVHPVWLAVPKSMAPSTESEITLTVDKAGTSSTSVSLTSSDTSQLTVPSSVTVPSGQTSVQFEATTTASASTSATISARANGTEITSSGIPFVTPGP